jgi:hypothetical protein
MASVLAHAEQGVLMSFQSCRSHPELAYWNCNKCHPRPPTPFHRNTASDPPAQLGSSASATASLQTGSERLGTGRPWTRKRSRASYLDETDWRELWAVLESECQVVSCCPPLSLYTVVKDSSSVRLALRACEVESPRRVKSTLLTRRRKDSGRRKTSGKTTSFVT